MIGIWHEGDSLKRYLVHPILGWLEHGSLKSSWPNHSLIRVSSPWYFMCKCIGSYVVFMVVISMLFLLFICWLRVYFMIMMMCVSHHVLICK